MDKTVAEFRELIQKAEKWVPIAGKFDDIMSRFNDHMKNQLDSANKEVVRAEDIANDIARKLAEMQAEFESWEAEAGLRDMKGKMARMEKLIECYPTEARIREIKIKVATMEKDIETLGTKIMHVAIAQANTQVSVPRGRQTARERSQSWRRAIGILKGLDPPIDDVENQAEIPQHHPEVALQPAHLPLTHVRPNTFG